MPWSASEASSRAAQQRIRQQHANDNLRFHQRNQQRASKQMSEMMEKSRATRRERRQQQTQNPAATSPYTNHGQRGDSHTQSGGFFGSIVVILVGVTLFAICAGTLVVLLGLLSSDVIPPAQTTVRSANGPVGGVVVTEAWNVRTEPLARSPIVGTVQPGDAVSVLCMTDGWAKLTAPFGGSYVYAAGVNLSSEPPPC